jgi:hypothetical protein
MPYRRFIAAFGDRREIVEVVQQFLKFGDRQDHRHFPSG